MQGRCIDIYASSLEVLKTAKPPLSVYSVNTENHRHSESKQSPSENQIKHMYDTNLNKIPY